MIEILWKNYYCSNYFVISIDNQTRQFLNWLKKIKTWILRSVYTSPWVLAITSGRVTGIYIREDMTWRWCSGYYHRCLSCFHTEISEPLLIHLRNWEELHHIFLERNTSDFNLLWKTVLLTRVVPKHLHKHLRRLSPAGRKNR